jgi:plasmid stabilization system protein ParE
MAKARKIEWSVEARFDIVDILSFYNERNGNNIYSGKLYNQIQKVIKLIALKPFLGKQSDIENIRVVMFKDYLIFYEVQPRSVLIITIWDCRRNPETLNIK